MTNDQHVAYCNQEPPVMQLLYLRGCDDCIESNRIESRNFQSCIQQTPRGVFRHSRTQDTGHNGNLNPRIYAWQIVTRQIPKNFIITFSFLSLFDDDDCLLECSNGIIARRRYLPPTLINKYCCIIRVGR